MELCAGTLEDVCKNEYKGPALPPDATVLYDIACGLTYIHSKNLVHRDIKPTNVLISLTDPVTIKISDFGLLSKPTSSQGTFPASGIKETLNWTAPECFPPQDSKEGIVERGSIESDIFSAGCVFFYFVTRGIHPFGVGVGIVANIRKDKPVNLNGKKILKNSFLKYDTKSYYIPDCCSP